ncbi:hypothetical protein ACFFX1_54960 [Dactylosporangium sucinum]|uniref:Uncharacterized protein n=1 Tax=Dactylosporangium sucinum TaxID=1424081 RepID=A0A917U3R4_9ACTN|nr:hypothetical protein [Dactylosporangium sucinum]GGM53319.1 hypothetical protein GCM10007977_063680 [Dactylosporangium sucinum]
MADNPVRPCFGCQQFDDHPRHEIIGLDGSDLVGGPMHKDCCAELRGCQVCAYERQGLDPSVIGEAFREHLLALPPAQVVHVPNDNPGDPLNLTTAVVTPLEG